MPINIPEIDKGGDQPDPESVSRLNEIELRALDADAKAKENRNREADQRSWLRWLAVMICVLLIVGMGGVLWHTAHSIFSPNYTQFSASYIVATYLAPIASMTTLAVALLVAAFRGFRKTDEADAAATTAEAARVGGLVG